MIRKIAIATVLGAAVVSYFAPAQHAPQTPVSHDVAVPLLPAANVAANPAQEALAEDATEVVLGLRVRKDRDCQVELKDYVTPQGEMFAAYSCSPNQAATAHKYADYDNATLGAMAYADADAAALLGRRLIDKDTHKSYELLIRASALEGGNVEHIAWLSDQAFGAVAVDGEPHIFNLQRQYELAALAERLGAGPDKTRYLHEELLRFGVDERQLTRLNTRADVLLQSMRAIQQTVLGEITIGGQGDA